MPKRLKKLVLNKEVVAKVSEDQMNYLRGGGVSYGCSMYACGPSGGSGGGSGGGPEWTGSGSGCNGETCGTAYTCNGR